MIKTVNLQKIFRTEEVETWALNEVSAEIEEGEFVAIMGPSGCGKTTMLNILGLLDNPTGGEYYLNGTEVGKYSEKQRTRLRKGVIGFVFQSFNLIEELNVYENIELPEMKYFGQTTTSYVLTFMLPIGSECKTSPYIRLGEFRKVFNDFIERHSGS